MKFSILLSAFLAVVSIGIGATPLTKGDIDSRSVTEAISGDLVKRTDVETPQYKAVSQIHKVEKDKYYVFTLKWPRGQVGDGDTETSQELAQLRDKLGFDHIGIIAGPVTVTTTGKGKNLKDTYDFKGVLYHMVVVQDDKTELKQVNWTPDSKILSYAKDTTKKKFDALSKEAKGYIADHPVYSVDTNNCNSFVQYLLAQL